jgi:hypothetical protein
MKIKAVILVLVTALITTILTSPKFTSQLIRKPADHVFVGLTNYFEDFYYYLDQFNQGKEGNWLTENRFSIEKFPSSPVYFSHIILGKIGGALGWESFQSFNYFGIFFKFLFILSGYWLISVLFNKSLREQFFAFLIFQYSSGLPNLSIKFGKIDFQRVQDVFRTENRILARFGTSPNGMLTNFLFVVGFILLLKCLMYESDSQKKPNKKHMGIITFVLAPVLLILFTLLVVTDFTKAFLLLFIFAVVFFMKFRTRVWNIAMPVFKIIFIVLSLIFLIGALYIYFAVEGDPVYKNANAWDVMQYLQQIKSIGLINFFKGFGLQLPFFIYGFFLMIKKREKTLSETVLLVTAGVSVLLYMLPLMFQIPVPGFRFIFPAIYIFFSIFVLKAMESIAKYFKWRKALYAVIALYLSVSLVSFFRGWSEDIQPLAEPEYHFAYIPNELYAAFRFLRSAEPKDGNVLASPSTSIDLMIPGLAGRYTYTGHFLTTFESQQKDENANNFYTKWTDRPGTHTFLTANNIRFIVVTKYSATLNDIQTYYPFLKKVFSNPMVTVFRYDPPDV